MEQESQHDNLKFIAEKIYKDSLAFRLFRLHGYTITPKKARSFSKKMLQKVSTMKTIMEDNIIIFPNLSKVIDEELSIPWIARLDHLDHRMCIEQSQEGPLWRGKASFYTLSCVHSMELMQLAIENYTFRQSIYQNELKELKRWSKKWGLTEMGFGREKTLYCYFAIAASTSLPHDSIIRMLVAKSAIVITVADDFFDMRGTLEEWDGKGLNGPSKAIFDVLDDLVTNTTKELVLQGKIDVIEDFRDLVVAEVQRFLEQKRQELLAHIFTDDNGDFPSQWKYLHLSCFKGKRAYEMDGSVVGEEMNGNGDFVDDLNGDQFPSISVQYRFPPISAQDRFDDLGEINDSLDQDIGDKGNRNVEYEKSANRSDDSASKYVYQDKVDKIVEKDNDANMGSNRGVWDKKYADIVTANKIDNKLMEISTKISENGNEVVVLNDEMIESGCKAIIMDDMTARMCAKGEGRINLARVLIEVEAGKGLKKETEVVYKGIINHEKFTKIIKVEYAWKPPCCDKYKKELFDATKEMEMEEDVEEGIQDKEEFGLMEEISGEEGNALLLWRSFRFSWIFLPYLISDHSPAVLKLPNGMMKRRKAFREEMVDKWQYPPLLAYLETLQFTVHNVDQQTIMKHLSEDGSLFQSPSATAQAYISTRNPKCHEYLMSLVHKCPNGVELSMVDQLQKLGLSEYFIEEIESILKKVYRSYMEQESQHDNLKFIAEKIYKDSLAFRLFRLHVYTISPNDFFDMRGTLEELHMLIYAVYRWDGKGLNGPSKAIFDVLNDLVTDTTKELVLQGKIDVIEDFKDLWRETFNSWLTETTWGKSGYIPSMDEYLETGMISIATHVLVLTSSCFLNLPKSKVKPQKYESVTESLMATARLLNDIQSYKKEQEEGKMNLVLLHFKDNPNASLDDSVAEVQSVETKEQKGNQFDLPMRNPIRVCALDVGIKGTREDQFDLPFSKTCKDALDLIFRKLISGWMGDVSNHYVQQICYFYLWGGRLDVCVDLTGSSPLTQTGMVDFVSGRAVIDAAQHKRGKYMAKCAAIGYEVISFSFSSLGELEADAVTLLKRIRKFSVAQVIGTRAAIHIFNRISFAIAKGVKAQIVSRLLSNLL
uniref:Geranyllinalool synthase n=1 Tax=Tanacetum cinerariifolium TaxID=118510 RepID=A0A6L2LXF6_TANCI|nr:geranyllinalool synthase [Tanacetum cinerariifolium]